MTLRQALGGFLLAVLAAGLVGCHDHDTVTGPPATPTPTPTPIPVGGAWVGTFESDYPVLCSQLSPGVSSAQLQEQEGNVVTGTFAAQAGCRIDAHVLASRSGNDLTGTVVEGDFRGTLTGTVDATQLRLTVGTLSGPGYIPGGHAILQRR